METNIHDLSFQLSLSQCNNYQKPDLWVFGWQPVGMICGSGNEGEGGDANEDLSFEEESESHSFWDESEEE